MTWQKPDTDEEWRDALSAYLDNELGSDDRAGLEAALKQEPRWACELAELRWVRTTLQSWTMDVPDSARRELARTLEKAPAPDTKNSANAPRRRGFGAVLGAFVGGVALGAAAVFALTMNLNGASKEAPGSGTANIVGELQISDAQADAVLHEIAAENLKQAILGHQKDRNWLAVEQAVTTMQRDYGNSAALRELEHSDALRPFVRYRAAKERKG